MAVILSSALLNVLLLAQIVVGKLYKVAENTSMQQLQTELYETENIIQHLKISNENLIKNITIAASICNDTILRMHDNQTALLVAIERNNKQLVVILREIQEKESIQAQLESQLKYLYEDLGLFGLMHEIISEDILLLENRQRNKTNLHCETIILQLQKSQVKESTVRVRHFLSRPKKISDMQMSTMVIQSKLRLAKLEESKLRSEYNQLNMKRVLDKELCSLKQSELQKLLAYTKSVLQPSIDSIEVLKSGLQASNVLTDSLNLEIEYGEKLLKTLKESINTLKRFKKSFKKDEDCYNLVKQ